jgi:hypothetical protein
MNQQRRTHSHPLDIRELRIPSNERRQTHLHSPDIRESRSSSNERRHSRAIRIKRSPEGNVNVDDLKEIRGGSDYDWATLRMYNRIIDHRQKHPVKLNEDTTSMDATQNSQFASPHWNRSSDHGNIVAYEATFSVPVQHSDYSQEGEVFNFDP